MRAFIAIPIDASTQVVLSQYAERLKQTEWGEKIIWFPSSHYHLTLRFLGSKLEEEKVRAICKSMPNWFSEGMSYFEAEVKGIVPFPSERHPHTLVASLDATLMMQYLVREIEEQVKPFGLTRARQAFRPHISLGRIPRSLPPESIQIPQEYRKLQDLWLTVDRLTLCESQLTQNSPIYTPLQSIELERYD